MTIDEAIKQEKEKAVDCRQGAEVVKNMTYATWERENLPKQYIERAEYHEQLAEWLEELKKLRQNRNETPLATFTFNKAVMQKMVDEKVKEIELDIKAIRNQAIDDFTEALKQDVMAKTFGLRICDVDRIAEQLKEGSADNEVQSRG